MQLNQMTAPQWQTRVVWGTKEDLVHNPLVGMTRLVAVSTGVGRLTVASSARPAVSSMYCTYWETSAVAPSTKVRAGSTGHSDGWVQCSAEGLSCMCNQAIVTIAIDNTIRRCKSDYILLGACHVDIRCVNRRSRM